MSRFSDDEFEADQDLSILEEAKRIKADDKRLGRVRDRIDERRREFEQLSERMDEPELPEAGVTKLGGLDRNGK